MPGRPAPARRAFTLIELLVVLTILALIASLVIATIPVATRALKNAKTKSIIAMAQAGLAKEATARGLSPTAVAHPLGATAAHALFAAVGTYAPRARYYRAGTLLDLDDEGVVAEAAWFPPGVRPEMEARMFHEDDRFAGYLADGDVPALFGLPRRALGILGTSLEWVAQARKFPDPNKHDAYRGSSGMEDGERVSYLLADDDGAYDGDVYPDRQFLQVGPLKEGVTAEEAQRTWLTACLGATLNELAGQEALVASPAADDAAWIEYVTQVPDPRDPAATIERRRDVDVAAPAAGSYDRHHRVWLADGDLDTWEPGAVLLDGSWRRYRIRGTSLVDAWGRELLLMIGPGETVFLLSAGEDGCFVVHPGDNGVIDTDIAGLDPADPATLGEDDRGAVGDNLGMNAVWHGE